MSQLHDTWSIRNVEVVYATLGLQGGAADEALITIKENAPRAMTKAGITGKHAVSLSADTSVTLEITLFAVSDEAKTLYSAYQALKQSVKSDTPVLGAAPFVVKEPSGSFLLVGAEALLLSVSDVTFGEEVGNITFTLFVPDGVSGNLPESLEADLTAVKAGFSLT